MLDKPFADRFAAEWVAAWNSHDLDRVLAHYADGAEMSSPFIAAVAGEASGTLRGKAALRAYWSAALAQFPDLRFELIDTFYSARSVAILYRSVQGLRAVEWLWFDRDGKVARAAAHYDG